MDLRTSLRDRLLRLAVGVAAVVMALTVGFVPQSALAIGAEAPAVYPCGPIPGVFVTQVNPFVLGTGVRVETSYECHFYDLLKALSEELRNTVMFGVVTALLDSMTVFTQAVAEQTANWVYSGFDETPQFFTKEYGAFLKDIVTDVYNRQLSNLNESFFKDELGWDLCQPLNLNLRVALGVGRMARLPPPNCTFETVKAAFNQTKDSLSKEQIATSLKQSVAFGGNDINIAISANQKILQKIVDTKQERILDRQEGGGFKNVKDLINGNIRQPSQVARDTVSEANLLKRLNSSSELSTGILAQEAMVAGLKQLPFIAAGSFVNTVALRAVADLQKFLQGEQATDPDVIPIDLTLDGADQSAESGTAGSVPERRKNIIAQFFSDIFRPNLNSGEQQDFTVLMSTCPTPRGIWGCSMDNGLAGALRAALSDGGMTVGKAAGLLPGANTTYLHADWELIPEWEAKDNQDTGCYQRAYCASNLAKLRFARIIPVGWELAANSVYNKKNQGKYVTLGQVIAGFNNCNAEGQIDDQHPWCKLINPAWVLTAPPFKCSVEGFTDAVFGGEQTAGAVRIQECVDVVSCLTRDDKGNCVSGYGYCAAEKTVWRFGGDQCDEKFASCRSFKKPSKQLGAEPGSQATTNEIVSYVRNTIDYGACSADNSGCLYYLTMRDVSTSTPDVWRGSIASNWKIVDSTWNSIGTAQASRIYLDKTVKTCTSDNEGCSTVLAMQPQVSALNLIENGSFEQADQNVATKLKGWQSEGLLNKYQFAGFVNSAGDPEAFVGTVAADFPSSNPFMEMYQVIPVQGGRYYTMSLYGKNRVSGQTGAIEIQATFLSDYTGNGSFVDSVVGKRYTILGAVPTGVTYGSDCQVSSGSLITSQTGLADAWGREACSFSIPNGVTGLRILVRAKTAVIDGAQLEESQAPTGFVDGVNSSLEVKHLKLAPEEYACTGNKTTDRAECGKFARVCSQIDAGCQAYSELGGDGTEIPANLSQSDYCPESCVGYAEYRKQSSSFDLTKNTENAQLNDADDDTVANFIPTNSLQCTADAAGCEEFTSVENQAAGGETKAYFQYVRACEKPGTNSKTFFTWEGSDQTGYQLRTWSLIANGDQPKVLSKAGPDGILKSAANCNEVTWKSGADLDCRQFYNEGGSVFYTYFSQTILSTAACTDYRVSFSNIDDCTKTGGNWNAAAKQCTYSISAPESTSCPAQYAGCRGYVGTTGKNRQTVISDTFANSSSTAGFVKGSALNIGSGSNLSYSKEALLVGDFSLKITNPTDGNGGVQASFTSATGGLYMVSFWAKTTKQSPADSFVAVQDAANNKSPFRLTTEWKRFELGPFATNKTAQNTVYIYNLPNETYLDEVKVLQLRDVSYVVKDTWVIPAECDRTLEGVSQPQAMLGCRAYQDRNGKKVNVRQFNNLCKFETVGCTGFVDTRNSQNPYVEQFAVSGLPEQTNPARPLDNLYSGTVTTTRPADRFVYVIDEPAARCDASQASCRAFGKPSLDSKWKQTGTETVYLIDDITKYTSNGEPATMCRPSELFCDTFVSNSVVSYFRDPQDHTCTWKDKVSLPAASGVAGPNGSLAYSYPAGEYSGWFNVAGTSTTPCYPHLLSNANTFLMDSPFANSYQGYTANCPKDQSECTEFRDSNDHTDPAKPVGKPYYFINNSRIDKSSCGDVADPFNGCVLIRDMTDADLRFNTKATYAESRAKGDVAVTPLDCKNADKDNPNCKNAGVCINVTCSGPDCGEYGADGVASMSNLSCSTDVDCFDDGTNSEGQNYKYEIKGTCQLNDANRIIKVKLDRDCQAWFGCRSGETVYDDAQQKYVDLCTDYALCDRAGGSSQGNFCSHYIDRSLNQQKPKKITEPYFEPVLREGVFINDRAYSMRSTQFVDPDYSGYSIGNRFQMADLMSRRVGYEILQTDPATKKRANDYFDDYRLVSAVPLALTAEELGKMNDPKNAPYGNLGWAVKIVDPTKPLLNLCQHNFTKQVGYYIPGEEPKRCYLAIDTPLTQVVTDVQGAAGNSRNAQTIATVFAQDPSASKSIYMNQVMPGVECKAYPDSQSPFGNEFVKEWDTTVQPNKPKTYVAGFEKVATCERGEDCSCQYAKVNYDGGVTKYMGVLTKNAPPQGVCVGGAKDGQACIPDAKQSGSVDYSDPNAAFDASINEACGSGSTCKALQGTTYVRGTSGFCIQRDSATTVGDKGRYQCLTWHPQPVLAGSKDIYHYSPTAGYNPPLNSGEYYCVSPVNQTIQGILAKKDDFSKPGSADEGGWTYDERCLNASYKLPVVDSKTRSITYIDKGASDDLKAVEASAVQKNQGTPNYSCKIFDGSDLRVSEMAVACGRSPVTNRNRFTAEYNYKVNPSDGYLTDRGNFFEEHLQGLIGGLEIAGGLATFNFSLLGDGFTTVAGSFVCLFSDCDSYAGLGTWINLRTFVSRSTMAVPTMKGIDEKTFRVVSTGEGKDASYAEYFIPASSSFVSSVLTESGNVPTAGGQLLESQIGYFRFHVPMPGVSDPDYSDEKFWSMKPEGKNVFEDPQRFAFYDEPAEGHKLLPNCEDSANDIPCDDNEGQDPGIVTDLPQDAYDSNTHTIVGTKVDPLYDLDFPTGQSQGLTYGTLGCLMSPEWAGVQVADWSDEQVVKQASDSWYKTFSKKFKGVLSRAKQGFLTSQDGTQLLQIPCQSGSGSCYYKYWEMGYQDEDAEKFHLFNTTDGGLGPVVIGSDKYYLRRASGTNPYFSIRAMFEDMSTEDNSTSPLNHALDGSTMRGPFKFVGFWVTASSPNTASSRSIYMRLSAATANTCRDVAQVVSPKDRSSSAMTDRVWEQSNFTVPKLNFTYGTENSPFGSALHQRMIGHDPMLMLDTGLGIVSPEQTFIKPGQQYDTRSRTDGSATDNSHIYSYYTLSNLFARVYQVYQFYDVSVKKNESMCFFGPYAGRRCGSSADCNPDGTCQAIPLCENIGLPQNTYTDFQTKLCNLVDQGNLSGCKSILNTKDAFNTYKAVTCLDPVQKTTPLCQKVLASAAVEDFKKTACGLVGADDASLCQLVTTNTCNIRSACRGGVYNGRSCKNNSDCSILENSTSAWVDVMTPGYQQLMAESCQSVGGSSAASAASIKKNVSVAGFGSGVLGVDCKGVGDPNSNDPDLDQNRCTHGVGYYPRPDLCITNPDNIECLIGSRLASADAYDMGWARTFPQPTDVTQGLYALASGSGNVSHVISAVNGVPNKPDDNSFKLFAKQDFVSSYVPRAPRVAAPDTSRQCASPGQCAIAKMDALNVDNASEGPVIYFGSQSNVTMRFYAWSADNQAPISNVWVDWGDGSIQRVSDARVKNKKPFCGVSKQCEFAPGLTCNSDTDCPPAAGKCYGTGFCSNNSGRSCRVGLAGNSDCDAGGTCVERLTYGSSPLACEANYFEFKHSYTCTQASKPSAGCDSSQNQNQSVPPVKSCTVANSVGSATVCRFVPRVFIEDNWGWCTGDCKQSMTGSLALKNPALTPKDVSFKNGGCYDGSVAQAQFSSDGTKVGPNMCDAEDTAKKRNAGQSFTYDPWLRFNGFVEMRSNE